jgi:hypothetical protein
LNFGAEIARHGQVPQCGKHSSRAGFWQTISPASSPPPTTKPWRGRRRFWRWLLRIGSRPRRAGWRSCGAVRSLWCGPKARLLRRCGQLCVSRRGISTEVRFCGTNPPALKNNSVPFQYLITFLQHILSTPSASAPILAPSPPSGTASGVVCGREGNGALRRVIDEITRPGRPCPRVPRRHYGRLCRTEHCTEPESARRKCRGGEGEGSGTDAAFRTPDRVRGFAIH